MDIPIGLKGALPFSVSTLKLPYVDTYETLSFRMCVYEIISFSPTVLFSISWILDAKYPRPSFEQGYIQTLLLWMITFSSSIHLWRQFQIISMQLWNSSLSAIWFVKMHSISAHFCNLVLAMLPFTKHMMHYVTNDNY